MSIDTTSWATNERETIRSFMQSQAQASADLSQNVLAFQADMADLKAAEIKFADDLAALATTLDSDAIDASVLGFQTASVDVDAEFSTLQSLILENNAAASSLANEITVASSNIDLLNATRASLGANVVNYSKVLGSFRSFAVTPSSPPLV